jgi:hypothetical protein
LQAREFVLSDAETGTRSGDWSVSSTELGLPIDPPFRIGKRLLHGGKQEGVELIELDNGRMIITVVPTRGVSLLQARTGDVSLGWTSPVKQVVNPAFIELDARGGLGWLDGFNEMLVRCGFEWAGHPGLDNGKLLTLHGRAGNTPPRKWWLCSTRSRPTGCTCAAVSTGRSSSSPTTRYGPTFRPNPAVTASRSATL